MEKLELKLQGGLTEGLGSIANDLLYGNDVDFLKAGASVLSGLFMSAGSQNGRIGSYTNAKTSLNGLSQGDKLYDKVYRHYVKVKKN